MDSDTEESQSFKFYRGIVVDNNDPEKYGRVRVKLFGLNEHEAIDNLPWAEVMQPAGFGLVSGVGLSAVLKQGTWVCVVFEDNDPDKQIVLGVFTGINEVRTDGYLDPDNVYPLPACTGQSDFGQCNINDFSLENKALTDTTMSSHGVMFNSQTSVSEDKYRDSWVLRSEKGILIEIDDADTQIKLTHPEGSVITVGTDGTVKVSSVKDIVLNAKENLEFNVLKDFKLNVDGDIKCDLLGDFKMFCDGSLVWNVSKSLDCKVKEAVNVETSKVMFKVSDSYNVSSVNVKFSSSESYKISGGRLSVNTDNGLIKGSNIITSQKLNLSTHRHRRSGSPRKPS